MIGLLQRRDVIAGAALIVLAVGVAIMAAFYPSGGRNTVGPAVFPLWAAGIVFVSGVIVLAQGVVREMAGVDWGDVRPAAFIAAAFVVFSLLIERGGLVPATLAGGLIATLGNADQTWLDRLLTTLALVAGTALFFVDLLGLPLRLIVWPI